MGGEDDGKSAQTQVAGEPQAQGDETAAQQAQVTGSVGGGDAEKVRADYEVALKEHDDKIAELEGEIAEAAKTAESAEKLRAEMGELRCQGDAQRVSFELQLAGARNVKAATALLPDYDNDVEKLRAAEPWLFVDAGAPKPKGVTGLPNAGGVSIVLSTPENPGSRHAEAGPGDGAAAKPGVPRRHPSRYGVLSRMIA